MGSILSQPSAAPPSAPPPPPRPKRSRHASQSLGLPEDLACQVIDFGGLPEVAAAARTSRAMRCGVLRGGNQTAWCLPRSFFVRSVERACS